ncbi:MAG: DoxX family protein [Mycobacterium sp.]
MNLALWIVAGLLAVAYLIGGAGKVIMQKEKIAAATPSARWVEDFSAGSVKAIGALEVLGAAGLILPAALDIAPVLVPLAAAGLGLIMVGAAITRLRRHELKAMAADLAYLALAAFVAWGRFGPESFTAQLGTAEKWLAAILTAGAVVVALWIAGHESRRRRREPRFSPTQRLSQPSPR